MKRFELVLLSIVIGMIGFVAIQAVSASGITATTETAELAPVDRSTPRAARRAGIVAVVAGDVAPAPSRDLEEIWRRIREGAPGTYNVTETPPNVAIQASLDQSAQRFRR